MRKFDLVIFDCDGVLLDSEINACRADAETYTRLGYAITTEEVVRRFSGMPDETVDAALAVELGTALNGTINALAGSDNVSGLAGDDLLGGGNDSIKGAVRDDHLRGNGDDDTLKGGCSADNLNGGGGTNTLKGKRGDGTLKGSGGTDTLQFHASNRVDTIRFWTSDKVRTKSRSLTAPILLQLEYRTGKSGGSYRFWCRAGSRCH